MGTPEPIADYILGQRVPACHLDLIEGRNLFRVVRNSASGKAPGPDSWRTEELKRLPEAAYTQLAQILGAVEKGSPWPEPLLTTWVSLIHAGDLDAAPLKHRPISLLSNIVRIYAKTRLSDLADWLGKTMPPEIQSYIPGRDVRKRLVEMSVQAELLQAGALPGNMWILSLDASKAFPSVVRSQLWEILISRGLPKQVASAMERHYSAGKVFIRVAGKWVHPDSTSLVSGIHQGCALSVMSFLAVQIPMLDILRKKCPTVDVLVFADDVSLVAESCEELQEAWNAISGYYKHARIDINPSKTQLWNALGSEGEVVIGKQEGQGLFLSQASGSSL